MGEPGKPIDNFKISVILRFVMNQHNLMRLTPIPSNLFTYDRTTRTFDVEASTLNGNGHRFLQQIYKDACDVGFVMKSSITGNEVTYYLEQEHREPSEQTHGGLPVELGDITHWTFRPTNESCQKFREAMNTKVVVWND